jgi:hypothetical protein
MKSEPRREVPEKHESAAALRCSRVVMLLAASTLVLLPSGAGAQVQEMLPSILSSGVREATVAQTPVIEKPGQRPATHSLFDAAGLSPIESIGAGSDIRAFLAPGVPQDLMLAALRRAWSTDPVIRDFIGLSENSWDFNASDGIPGFGPLITDDAGRLAAEAAGNAVLNVSDKSATELNPSRR